MLAMTCPSRASFWGWIAVINFCTSVIQKVQKETDERIRKERDLHPRSKQSEATFPTTKRTMMLRPLKSRGGGYIFPHLRFTAAKSWGPTMTTPRDTKLNIDRGSNTLRHHRLDAYRCQRSAGDSWLPLSSLPVDSSRIFNPLRSMPI